MSIAVVHSRALLGVEALAVTVETHLSNGLPSFAIVGLPETAVKESKERVRSAILNSGLEFPTRRITVNLAPADIPKAGGRYDLAIALSILAASGQIDADKIEGMEILGELALDGSVRPVQGVIPALLAAQTNARQILLPQANAGEAALVAYPKARLVDSLGRCCRLLADGKELPPCTNNPIVQGSLEDSDFSDLQVQGQVLAKRAIEIAAAGGHNLLMVGPPGCGKSLLAEVMVRILPALSSQQAIETAAIRSAAGLQLNSRHWWRRPIRSPHHSATAVALVGGGSQARAGEISLAHHGVLFLDELTEFKPSVLDSLREPLESGRITISRANYQVVFPANFQLIAAMNPCPCGQANNNAAECRCSPDRVNRYLGRISGPLLDRFDLIVEMSSLGQEELFGQEQQDCNWQQVREQVSNCQERQLSQRSKLNASLVKAELDQYCVLDEELRAVLAAAMEGLGLSARAVHRILRVARTVADLQGHQQIEQSDLLEAIGFRRSNLTRSLAA